MKYFFETLLGRGFPKRVYTLALCFSFFAFFILLILFFSAAVFSFLPLVSDKFDFDFIVSKKVSSDTERLVRIFIFTFIQSFFSAGLAVCIGLPAAYFCAYKRFKGRSLLLALSSVPLCVPAVIVSLSYILFFGSNGFLNLFLHRILKAGTLPFPFLYSVFGIIICQGFYNFPVAMRIITEAWMSMPRSGEYAAALLGANKFRIFKTITLPYLLPASAASFLLVFLFCFFGFVIPLLFGGVGVSTLEVELYQAVRYSFDMKFAAKIALTEFLFASIIIFFYCAVKNKLSENKGVLELNIDRERISKGLERIFFLVTMSVILFFLIMPLISIIFYSIYTSDYGFGTKNFITVRAWKNVLFAKIFWKAFFNTVKVGIATAGLSVAAAICFAYLKLFYFKHPLFEVLPFFPLAVSSVMLGFGWKLLSSENNVLMLILAQASVYWTFAWTQLQISLGGIPEDLIAAAKLFDGKRGVFFKTVLPISKKEIAAAFAFVFAVSSGDASLPMVLGINNFKNLPLLLFGYASSYRFAESAVTAIILSILSGFVFFINDKQNCCR